MTIKVESPSRLHLGFLDLSSDYYHQFGGIGLALNKPKFKIEINQSDKLIVRGEEQERVKKYFNKIIEEFDLAGAEVIIKNSLPPHRGLGSGTAITMAALHGLNELYNLDMDLEKAAYRVGRGNRSGIGIKASLGGGFIIELGNQGVRDKRTVLIQESLPDDWKIVLVVPQGRGLYGNREERAFEDLECSSDVFGEVCRTTLISLIPAFKKKNFREFGKAITHIQKSVGKFFSDIQGGIFVTDEANEIFSSLDFFDSEVMGYGQSSWGPSFFLFVDEEEAENLRGEVKGFLNRFEGEYEIFVNSVCDEGTRIISS